MVKACTFDICPRRLAFGLFAGLSSGEWVRSWTMGQFPWQSDSGQIIMADDGPVAFTSILELESFVQVKELTGPSKEAKL